MLTNLCEIEDSEAKTHSFFLFYLQIWHISESSKRSDATNINRSMYLYFQCVIYYIFVSVRTISFSDPWSVSTKMYVFYII
jgi:hypothetical protein